MSDKRAMIQVKQVVRDFVLPNETVHALKGVSFEVPRGSFTLIYGPSGSGKSTMLNTLVGLDEPTSGQVVMDGQDLYELSRDERANFRARTVGMVYQTNYWVNSLTVLQNVSMPLYLAGYSYRRSARVAEESLEKVGMQDFRHQHPSLLSGGQQQRVSMARALAADPELIVADEPTGNLDTKNGDMIMNLLSELCSKAGKTIVLVTHNLEYLPLSNHQVRLKDGQLVSVAGADPTSSTLLNAKSRAEKLKDFQASIKASNRKRVSIDAVKRNKP